MPYNKHYFKKINDKKVLHKVHKNWVIVSLALLRAISNHEVNDAESIDNLSNANTTDVNNASNHSDNYFSTSNSSSNSNTFATKETRASLFSAINELSSQNVDANQNLSNAQTNFNNVSKATSEAFSANVEGQAYNSFSFDDSMRLANLYQSEAEDNLNYVRSNVNRIGFDNSMASNIRHHINQTSYGIISNYAQSVATKSLDANNASSHIISEIDTINHKASQANVIASDGKRIVHNFKLSANNNPKVAHFLDDAKCYVDSIKNNSNGSLFNDVKNSTASNLKTLTHDISFMNSEAHDEYNVSDLSQYYSQARMNSSLATGDNYKLNNDYHKIMNNISNANRFYNLVSLATNHYQVSEASAELTHLSLLNEYTSFAHADAGNKAKQLSSYTDEAYHIKSLASSELGSLGQKANSSQNLANISRVASQAYSNVVKFNSAEHYIKSNLSQAYSLVSNANDDLNRIKHYSSSASNVTKMSNRFIKFRHQTINLKKSLNKNYQNVAKATNHIKKLANAVLINNKNNTIHSTKIINTYAKNISNYLEAIHYQNIGFNREFSHIKILQRKLSHLSYHLKNSALLSDVRDQISYSTSQISNYGSQFVSMSSVTRSSANSIYSMGSNANSVASSLSYKYSLKSNYNIDLSVFKQNRYSINSLISKGVSQASENSSCIHSYYNEKAPNLVKVASSANNLRHQTQEIYTQILHHNNEFLLKISKIMHRRNCVMSLANHLNNSAHNSTFTSKSHQLQNNLHNYYSSSTSDALANIFNKLPEIASQANSTLYDRTQSLQRISQFTDKISLMNSYAKHYYDKAYLTSASKSASHAKSEASNYREKLLQNIYQVFDSFRQLQADAKKIHAKKNNHLEIKNIIKKMNSRYNQINSMANNFSLGYRHLSYMNHSLKHYHSNAHQYLNTLNSSANTNHYLKARHYHLSQAQTSADNYLASLVTVTSNLVISSSLSSYKGSNTSLSNSYAGITSANDANQQIIAGLRSHVTSLSNDIHTTKSANYINNDIADFSSSVYQTQAQIKLNNHHMKSNAQTINYLEQSLSNSNINQDSLAMISEAHKNISQAQKNISNIDDYTNQISHFKSQLKSITDSVASETANVSKYHDTKLDVSIASYEEKVALIQYKLNYISIDNELKQAQHQIKIAKSRIKNIQKHSLRLQLIDAHCIFLARYNIDTIQRKMFNNLNLIRISIKHLKKMSLNIHQLSNYLKKSGKHITHTVKETNDYDIKYEICKNILNLRLNYLSNMINSVNNIMNNIQISNSNTRLMNKELKHHVNNIYQKTLVIRNSINKVQSNVNHLTLNINYQMSLRETNQINYVINHLQHDIIRDWNIASKAQQDIDYLYIDSFKYPIMSKKDLMTHIKELKTVTKSLLTNQKLTLQKINKLTINKLKFAKPLINNVEFGYQKLQNTYSYINKCLNQSHQKAEIKHLSRSYNFIKSNWQQAMAINYFTTNYYRHLLPVQRKFNSFVVNHHKNKHLKYVAMGKMSTFNHNLTKIKHMINNAWKIRNLNSQLYNYLSYKLAMANLLHQEILDYQNKNANQLSSYNYQIIRSIYNNALINDDKIVKMLSVINCYYAVAIRETDLSYLLAKSGKLHLVNNHNENVNHYYNVINLGVNQIQYLISKNQNEQKIAKAVVKNIHNILVQTTTNYHNYLEAQHGQKIALNNVSQINNHDVNHMKYITGINDVIHMINKQSQSLIETRKSVYKKYPKYAVNSDLQKISQQLENCRQMALNKRSKIKTKLYIISFDTNDIRNINKNVTRLFHKNDAQEINSDNFSIKQKLNHIKRELSNINRILKNVRSIKKHVNQLVLFAHKRIVSLPTVTNYYPSLLQHSAVYNPNDNSTILVYPCVNESAPKGYNPKNHLIKINQAHHIPLGYVPGWVLNNRTRHYEAGLLPINHIPSDYVPGYIPDNHANYLLGFVPKHHLPSGRNGNLVIPNYILLTVPNGNGQRIKGYVPNVYPYNPHQSSYTNVNFVSNANLNNTIFTETTDTKSFKPILNNHARLNYYINDMLTGYKVSRIVAQNWHHLTINGVSNPLVTIAITPIQSRPVHHVQHQSMSYSTVITPTGKPLTIDLNDLAIGQSTIWNSQKATRLKISSSSKFLMILQKTGLYRKPSVNSNNLVDWLLPNNNITLRIQKRFQISYSIWYEVDLNRTPYFIIRKSNNVKNAFVQVSDFKNTIPRVKVIRELYGYNNLNSGNYSAVYQPNQILSVRSLDEVNGQTYLVLTNGMFISGNCNYIRII